MLYKVFTIKTDFRLDTTQALMEYLNILEFIYYWKIV